MSKTFFIFGWEDKPKGGMNDYLFSSVVHDTLQDAIDNIQDFNPTTFTYHYVNTKHIQICELEKSGLALQAELKRSQYPSDVRYQVIAIRPGQVYERK